uniref:Uncharacterized protein n=1 Tax=Rhizophora mucronata TaxID=61149 RepID=A0A2P2NJK1_RHIMU
MNIRQKEVKFTVNNSSQLRKSTLIRYNLTETLFHWPKRLQIKFT